MSNADLKLLQDYDPSLYRKWVAKKEQINRKTYYETETRETTDDSGATTTEEIKVPHHGTEYSRALESNIGDCLRKVRHSYEDSSGNIHMHGDYDKYLLTLSGYATMFSVDSAKEYGGKKLITCNGLFDKINNDHVNVFTRMDGDSMRELVESTDISSVSAQESALMESFSDIMTNRIMCKSMVNMVKDRKRIFNQLDLPASILN